MLLAPVVSHRTASLITAELRGRRCRIRGPRPQPARTPALGSAEQALLLGRAAAVRRGASAADELRAWREAPFVDACLAQRALAPAAALRRAPAAVRAPRQVCCAG